jgi:hypothetical protein
MHVAVDLDSLLPGEEWQRLETWAALAGMSPVDYVRACVRRGHEEMRQDLGEVVVGLQPGA